MDKYILYAVVSICIPSTKLKIKVLFFVFLFAWFLQLLFLVFISAPDQDPKKMYTNIVL